MLCKDLDVLDVVEDDGREGDVVYEHDSPGDEDAVAANTRHHDPHRTFQHR